MGTTVDSRYIRPSSTGTAWSGNSGRPADAAAAESSTVVMGPFVGAGGAVAGGLLPSKPAAAVEGGVPDDDMVSLGAKRA